MKPKNLQVHFRTTLQIATSCLVVVSVRFSHIYEILQPLENRGLVGSQCLNCTKKSIRSTSTLASNFAIKMNISDLSVTTNPKSVVFLEIQSSDFKRGAQIGNCHFHCEIRRKRWLWAYAFLVRFKHWGSHQPSIFKKLKIFIYMRKT